MLRGISDLLHLLADLFAYGIVGPIASWYTLTWLGQQFQARENALAAKDRAESEQRRVQEAAREQERLLATICSNTADAIISLDTEGIVRTWNRGAEMMLGYSEQDVLGRHFGMLVPPEIARAGKWNG